MAATSAYIAAAAAVAGVAQSADTSRQAKNARGDIARDKTRLESESAQRAVAQTKLQRTALRKNSLFTGAGDAGGGGQQTLGV